MTIHHSTETAPPDATKRYPSDLNDREFDLVAPHVAQKAGSGKKRIVISFSPSENRSHKTPTTRYPGSGSAYLFGLPSRREAASDTARGILPRERSSPLQSRGGGSFTLRFPEIVGKNKLFGSPPAITNLGPSITVVRIASAVASQFPQPDFGENLHRRLLARCFAFVRSCVRPRKNPSARFGKGVWGEVKVELGELPS